MTVTPSGVARRGRVTIPTTGAVTMSRTGELPARAHVVIDLEVPSVAPNAREVTPVTTGEDDPRRWWSLAVLCLCVVVIILDNTILNVALPSIVESMHASNSQLQWTIDAYTLVFAALLLTAGTAGDRYGRRGALMIGLGIFGAGSTMAAFAWDPLSLIAFRAVMGIGAALIFPTTLSIITNIFSGEERGKAIGIWSALSGVGIALGPILGGLLLEWFWWGSVFLVNVPIVLVGIPLVWKVVPTSRDPAEPRLDLVGVALSVLALGGVLFGIIQGPVGGWTSPPVLVGLIVGGALLVAFLVWERRDDEPMLPLEFFRNARFSAAAAAITLAFFGLLGFVFLLTQYLQFVEGNSPLVAGLRLAPPAAGLMISAPGAPRLARVIGAKFVVAGGLVVAAGALVALSFESVLTSVPLQVSALALFGVGMGATIAPATDSVMGSVPRDRAGVGSAVNDTTRQTGGALGVAILGSIFSVLYSNGLGGLPGRLPPPVASAVDDGIGNALRAAAGLPPDQARTVVSTAKSAFTDAIGTTALLAAGAVLIGAVVALLALPSHAEEPEPDDRGAVGGAGAGPVDGDARRGVEENVAIVRGRHGGGHPVPARPDGAHGERRPPGSDPNG
jgi:EmrB/QacA subfamily drug resistance transporter